MNDLIVKPVDVLGSQVMAAKDDKGQIWAGVRWFCQGLGFSKGQIDRQTKNIQKDSTLSKGASNLTLPTNGGKQEVLCLRIDFIPLWLTKISITEKTRQERPEFAEKLLNYQLKAKDILAAAFLPKQEPPTSIDGQIQLLAQGYTNMKEEVDGIKSDLQALKMDLPILPIESDRITEAVKKKGVCILGGKTSPAYNNRGLRQKLYSNLYSNLKYNFDVRSYKSIKRSQCDKAIEIIQKYEPPVFLADQIEQENAQMHMNDIR